MALFLPFLVEGRFTLKRFVFSTTALLFNDILILAFVTNFGEVYRMFRNEFGIKTCDPVNIGNIWRIRNNMEIDRLIEGADIMGLIKAQRIKWLGHIQRMDRARPTRKLLDWEPVGTRSVGRTRQRWQEDVMGGLKKLKIKNWKERAKDRRTWRGLAEKAKTHKWL